MRVLKVKHPKQEPERQRYKHEAGGSSDRSDQSPHLGAHAHGDANDIWPRHELAKAQDVGKLLFADPLALLDRYATRPDNAAAETIECDLEERNEKRIERNGGSRHFSDAIF
jgi:hypothetical protein